MVTSRYSGFSQLWACRYGSRSGSRGSGGPIDRANSRKLLSWPRTVGRTGAMASAPTSRSASTARLDRHGADGIAKLAEIARRNPAERLVLLCFEDVNAGEECHRRWLAEWMEQKYQLTVTELPDADAQLRFAIARQWCIDAWFRYGRRLCWPSRWRFTGNRWWGSSLVASFCLVWFRRAPVRDLRGRTKSGGQHS